MEEARAFQAVLADHGPDEPTACRGWRVRDVVAHLAAGADEESALIEAALRGEPARPTRPFGEREARYREMAYPELLTALARESRRLGTAIGALTDAGGEVEFTGARLAGRDLRTHGRSELAIHRWDITGDDETGRRLLGQPDLTAHAVRVLPAMTSLQESIAVRAARVTGVPEGFAFRLRSPGSDDVLVRVTPVPAIEMCQPGGAIAVVRSSPADRLLMLSGRRPPAGRVDTSGVPAQLAGAVAAFRLQAARHAC